MKILEGIDNLIFDLGMVLLNINPQLTADALAQLAGKEITDFEDFIPKQALFDIEEGKTTPAEFRQIVRKAIGRPVTDPEIDYAWNAIILDIPKEHIELLENLRKKYKLFLLSNTNIMHYHVYNARVQREFGKSLDDYFDHAYYSHNMDCRKPAPKIYQMVIDEQKLDPNATLFIDDRQDNIGSAQRCGLKTFWLEPGTSVIPLFK